MGYCPPSVEVMKNIIQLEEDQYEVRHVDGNREILLNGTWELATDFVDYLSETKQWGKMVVLANYGQSLI